MHLSAYLQGAGAIALRPSPLLLGAGQLFIDLGVTERYGLIVGGQLSSSQQEDQAPGGVRWRRNPLFLLGRFTFWPSPRHGLSLEAGVLVDLIAAESLGFTTVREVVTVDPGLRAGGRWRARLVRGLYSTVGVGVDLLLRTTRFEVVGVGQVAETPRAWISLEAGLGWQFF